MCSLDATCTNTIGSYECECNENFSGDGICCNPDCPDCTENAYCSIDAECLCQTGYEGNGLVDCTDVNECESVSCPHSTECLNTPGSYICVCPDGLTMNNITGTCIDIDECNLNIHKCDIYADCTNIDGDYNCTCIEGTTGNGYYCKPECEHFIQIGACRNNTACSFDITGDVICDDCADGYELNDEDECTDINECMRSANYTCIEPTTCVNTEGSYECVCKPGYGFNFALGECEDLNECEGNNKQ